MRLLKRAEKGGVPESGCLDWIVEGRIAGEHAVLLDQEYRALAQEERRRLRVDLEKVTFVDDFGAEIIRRMMRETICLEHLNPYVHALVHGAGEGADSTPAGKGGKT